MAHAPAEFVDLAGASRQFLLAFPHDALGIVQRGLDACVHVLARQRGAHAVQRRRGARLHAPQPQHGCAERSDPVRFHQRFAGQAQQLVQCIRRHPQDALAFRDALV
ncbi:hypothetical protein G6F62_014744 [Rhizopus arrhizus]|nr:hypothetical protein G6F62_014744 [Rhizopus arrhizus]